MSTDDTTRTLPPHKLAGSLGQVGDAGGGIVPLLARAPVPNAAGGSPGLATNAATVPHAPTLPSDDPASMAVMLAAMANQIFLGSSVVPVPMSPNALVNEAGQAAPMASPGFAPTLIPMGIDTSLLLQPSEPSNAFAVGAFPESPTPTPPPPPTPSGGGLSPSADQSTSPFGPPSFATLDTTPVPSTPVPSTPVPSTPVPSTPVPSTPVPSTPVPSTPVPSTPVPSTPVPSTPVPSTPNADPTNPFAVEPSFDGLATFGAPQDVPAVPSIPGLPPPPSSPFGPSSIPSAAPSNPGGGTAIPVAGIPTGSAARLEAPDASTTAPYRPLALDGFEAFDAGRSFDLPFADARPIDAPPAYQPASIPGASAVVPAVPKVAGTEPVRQDHVAFDPYVVRKDFPILEERVHNGKRLIWLDNGATTQKPRAVIDRISYFYEHENSNIHRAAHTLAARASDAYENAREITRRFINAPSAGEIIFVRGATEGINLLANTWGRANVGEGDEIIITHLEHHANIVPWQMLCAATGARLKVAPVDDRGQILLAEYEKLFTPRTKLASITQVSNALGTITPAREMIEIAHRHGARVILDGAQGVSHMRVDVQLLDCDFYVFSGHKVFAPTGIGAVFGKRELLDAMPPWQGGGNLIADVTFEKTVYQPPPFRFEAGTGNIADAVGMGAALDYVMKIGLDVIDRYEHELLGYATERLLRVPGLRMLGTAAHKAGVMSFVLDGQRTEDVGAYLDKDGIAVRSGHHCAQPILRRLGVEASVRASLAFYNITEDIDALVESLHRLQAGRRLK